MLLDPFPTKLLMSHLSSILDIIICIVNLCFSILLIIFSLAYKAGHSCETALLRVYNDIVTTIG